MLTPFAAVAVWFIACLPSLQIRRDTLEVGMLDDVRQQARKVQTRVWNQTVRQVVGPDSYLASHLAPRKHVAKKDEE